MTRQATEPTITIVTACYNSSPFLDRLHRSLANQTYRRFEWICVDDQSKDDTVSRLVSLPVPGELGMQVYRLPQNTGGPVALAVGTQLAKGDAIIWLDHDDELFPDALQAVRDHWPMVNTEAGESGLFLRATDPLTGSMIGRELGTGNRLTWSMMSNRYPEISDGTFVFRTELLREFATVEGMESLNLNGILFNELTALHPFVAVDKSVRFYHRDNPEAQTRIERISRKSVATYARLVDGADRYYLLSPVRWIRHVVTTFRYSGLVHGSRLAVFRYIRKPHIRWFATALLPLSFFARYRNANEVLVEIPPFKPDLARGLPDLREGAK